MATSLSLNLLGATLSMRIQQGDDYVRIPLRIRNPDGSLIDRTGVTFAGHIRKNALDPDPPAAAFTFEDGDVAATAYMSLAGSATSALSAGESMSDAESQYVYDIRMVDSLGRDRTICGGPLLLNRQITKV